MLDVLLSTEYSGLIGRMGRGVVNPEPEVRHRRRAGNRAAVLSGDGAAWEMMPGTALVPVDGNDSRGLPRVSETPDL